MKAAALSARDRRALSLGAMILIPAVLIWGVLIPGGRALLRMRHEVTLAQADLQHDRALIAGMPGVDTQRVQTVRWLAREQRRLFRGHDDVEATGALTRYIEREANDAGIKLEHVETRPAVLVTGTLRAVELSLHIVGDVPTVMTFLADLEQGDRLVRLGHLIITHTGGGPANRGGPLNVSADVYGYTDGDDPQTDGVGALTTDGRKGHPYGGAAYVPLVPKTGDADDPPDVGDAIAHDPFSPDRGRTPVVAASAKPTTPVPPPTVVTLVGTVVGTNQTALAVCEVNNGAPVVLHIGQRIAGYTLSSVQMRAATLTDSTGHEMQLTIPKPHA